MPGNYDTASGGSIFESAIEYSEYETVNILKRRAKTLAAPLKKDDVSLSFINVVAFNLAHEIYGVESSYVKEVYPLTAFTTVPCTPPFVLGIINLHGEILSVIDIKKFFDLPDKGLHDLNKVIVLETDKMRIGILADSILNVRSIPLERLQPPLPTFIGIGSEYLKGIYEDRLVVLDAEKILSDKKLIINEEVII